MRFKPVPDPPADLEAVAAVVAAVPAKSDTSPGDVDCCSRLIERTGVGSREAAQTWLTFLRALELVAAERGRYRRTGREVERNSLRDAFCERVQDGSTVLAVLEASSVPLGSEAVTDRVRERSTRRERGRSSSGSRPSEEKRRVEDVERVERLLEWAVLFDLAERASHGRAVRYRRGSDGSDR
ncbi:hypothetical protein AB7C87_09990 [Natrarchaeobius sp. A-rgal3]|uniref:hypothetical protein n=1 Tax=Natrarchaeobius versutus TaxID=1679078 RepID=UPI00350FE708